MEPGAYTRVALYIPWIMDNTDYNLLRSSRSPKKDCPGIRCDVGGRCIAIEHVCDGVIDCLMAEDEKGCSFPYSDFTDTNTIDLCDKGNSYRPRSLGELKYARRCRNVGEISTGNFTEKGRYANNNESEDSLTPFSYNKTTQFLCKK
jgi:hypothetical protein